MNAQPKMKNSQPKADEPFNFDLQEMRQALKGKKRKLPKIKTVEDLDKWLEES